MLHKEVENVKSSILLIKTVIIRFFYTFSQTPGYSPRDSSLLTRISRNHLGVYLRVERCHLGVYLRVSESGTHLGYTAGCLIVVHTWVYLLYMPPCMPG